MKCPCCGIGQVLLECDAVVVFDINEDGTRGGNSELGYRDERMVFCNYCKESSYDGNEKLINILDNID